MNLLHTDYLNPMPRNPRRMVDLKKTIEELVVFVVVAEVVI